ncbi:MAG: VOC family protein [Candidatus Omnitrophota bacterium]
MLKIGHIALSVSNLDSSIDFYKKAFGFICTHRYPDESAGLEICLLKKDEVTLELFGFKDFKPLPEYHSNLDSDLVTLGVKHFCLGVADIEETYNRLRKSDIEFITDIRIFENGSRYFFIKDLDGILVEVMETQDGGRTDEKSKEI